MPEIVRESAVAVTVRQDDGTETLHLKNPVDWAEVRRRLEGHGFANPADELLDLLQRRFLHFVPMTERPEVLARMRKDIIEKGVGRG